MSKILMITNHSYMLYRFRLELIEELMKKHEVVLSMPFVGHENDFQALGLRCIDTKVDRRGINPKTDLKLFLFYWQLLRKEKPDLVVTYSIKPNVYAGMACSLQRIPYCANVQGLGTAFQKKGLAQFVTLLYKTAFCRVKTVFFENQANAQEFAARRIVSADKQLVLNGAGVNLEKYALQPWPENDKVHFLYLGRLMKEKGMDELFAAARRLQKEGHSFVLDMVGFFEDEYKEQVEELEKMGIAVFHGFQEEPCPYYTNADCVVMPSYHEGMSNVLLEAAAMGRPVITSRIPGCMETVLEKESGFLCQPQNSMEVYQAMKEFLALSKEQRIAMGRRGREHMESLFDKKKIVSVTVDALEAAWKK